MITPDLLARLRVYVEGMPKGGVTNVTALALLDEIDRLRAESGHCRACSAGPGESCIGGRDGVSPVAPHAARLEAMRRRAE